ncbi:MAG TPA: asparaginase domain-containing protein [Candidatus Nanoarchaeia archaeon]|nr:asparaginase domain-containing protein [Candidatus Nanoarchaeia archaeon]
MTIKIFITGGTIENLEYDAEEKAPTNIKSIIPELLKQARLSSAYSAEVLMMKDSKFVNNEDGKFILSKCKKSREGKIIITHGTATMPETAILLGKSKIKKTIVLTGSAIPAANQKSDALFNIGFAFSSVKLLPPGVYIAMNGKIFSWKSVKKNLTTGYFESIKGVK